MDWPSFTQSMSGTICCISVNVKTACVGVSVGARRPSWRAAIRRSTGVVIATSVDNGACGAVAAGGKVFKPKFAIGPYGFCALLTDTEGNCIGVHSMK